MPEEDWSYLLGDEPDKPAPKPRKPRKGKTAIEKLMEAGGRPRPRSVRVGRLHDLHDVEHEAARLFRAIRQNDGEDLILLHTAGDAIRSLKLVADAMGLGQMAAQMAEIKEMLAKRNGGSK